MTVFIVTYDLNKEIKRPNILADIKTYNWAKLSESCYAITTTSSASDVYTKLSKHIDGNDSLYIVTAKRPYTGRGPKDVNDWLERNLTY